MCPRPFRISLFLIPDRKSQMRLGRMVIALGCPQMRPLSVPSSPPRMGLRFGDLFSRRAVRAAISQLLGAITQLFNPSRNLITTPLQFRCQMVALYGRIGAVRSVVAHPRLQHRGCRQ